MENAVLICLDTVRYDTLELVREVLRGDPASRWWRRGVWLTRAQSTAPWTVPAVASVFTGLYPNEHRAGAFAASVADLRTSSPLPLAQGFPTLAGQLRKHDFETLGFVAQPWFQTRVGLEQGFGNLETGLQGWAKLLERAKDWSDRRGSDPASKRFLLYLHFMEAHRPSGLKPRGLGRRHLDELMGRLSPELRARAADAPACSDDDASLSCQRYLAYVSAVQTLYLAVADLLETLDAGGLLESSAIVLFSDHGEEFQEHAIEEVTRALDPRETYGEGHGHSLYQELLHVPLVFWHPALSGSEQELPASLVDVLPTLLGWLGLEVGRPVAGIDLGPALGGSAADPVRPLYASSVAYGPEREAVIRGGRKHISDGGSGAGALSFDLMRDPSERAPSTDAAGLDALLAGYRDRLAPRGMPTALTAEQIEDLQALGYLKDARVE